MEKMDVIRKPYGELAIALSVLILFILLTAPIIECSVLEGLGNEFAGRCVLGAVMAFFVYIIAFFVLAPSSKVEVAGIEEQIEEKIL